MKKVLIIIIVAIFCIGTSCKKDESYRTFERPTWQTSYDGYSVSMTCVMTLDKKIIGYVDSTDILAAFIGEECRGIAEYTKDKFFLNIVGKPEENSLITFKYYSAKNKYLYQEENLHSFVANDVLGVSDEPYILQLTLVQ
ncbi:MAG: hypothetical protein MJ211_10215 [Bacteroidales bacterium]|nr:hypothetical protein [Bacteroidales bacterium]